MTGPGLAHHLGDLLVDRRVVAAEQGRAAGLEEVDVDVAVAVGEVGAVGAVDRERERVVEGEVVLHAAGDARLRPVGELLAALALGLEPLEHVVEGVVAQAAHRLVDQGAQARHGVVDVGVAADRVAEPGRLGTGCLGRHDGLGHGEGLALGHHGAGRRVRAGERHGIRNLLRGNGLGDLRGDPLLVLAQLGEGDLADRGGDRVDLARLGGQRQQVGDGHLLEQGHVEHGALGVGADAPRCRGWRG